MNRRNAIELIIAELDKAEKKFPAWPTDPIHAAAVLGEEAGELHQACLDACYRGKDGLACETEAAQTGAMAVRFLMGLDNYKFKPGKQVGA